MSSGLSRLTLMTLLPNTPGDLLHNLDHARLGYLGLSMHIAPILERRGVVGGRSWQRQDSKV